MSDYSNPFSSVPPSLLMDVYNSKRLINDIFKTLAVPEMGEPTPSSQQSYQLARDEWDKTTGQHRADAMIWSTKIKTVHLTDDELFLMQCKAKFSPKIYHNIERRMRRQQKRMWWLYASTIRKSMLKVLETAIVTGYVTPERRADA